MKNLSGAHGRAIEEDDARMRGAADATEFVAKLRRIKKREIQWDSMQPGGIHRRVILSADHGFAIDEQRERYAHGAVHTVAHLENLRFDAKAFAIAERARLFTEAETEAYAIDENRCPQCGGQAPGDDVEICEDCREIHDDMLTAHRARTSLSWL